MKRSLFLYDIKQFIRSKTFLAIGFSSLAYAYLERLVLVPVHAYDQSFLLLMDPAFLCFFLAFFWMAWVRGRVKKWTPSYLVRFESLQTFFIHQVLVFMVSAALILVLMLICEGIMAGILTSQPEFMEWVMGYYDQGIYQASFIRTLQSTPWTIYLQFILGMTLFALVLVIMSGLTRHKRMKIWSMS